MRFIPTAIHGAADYIVGLLLACLPLLLGWSGAGRHVFVGMALFVIIYSACTDYELGLYRFLRLRFHLLLDGVLGVALLFAPRVLGLPEEHHTLVYSIGVLALVLAATTRVRAQGTQSNEAI